MSNCNCNRCKPMAAELAKEVDREKELSRIRASLVSADRRLIGAGLMVPEIQDAIRSLFDIGVDQ